MPHELMLKTLDHIEIGLAGTAEVVFCRGEDKVGDVRVIKLYRMML